jgi:hypothetical protein
VTRLWNGFFWGPPSHKPIAWVGALAGLGVFAIGALSVGKVGALFVLAVFLVGAAEFGWAAELLPRTWSRAAGWSRAARWLCAVAGTVLGAATLALGLVPTVWFGAIIAGTGLLLALEMAPSGPANRPAAPAPSSHKHA